jgi:hypothetical protein
LYFIRFTHQNPCYLSDQQISLNLNTTIHNINEMFKKYGFAVRFTRSEASGQGYYVFVNTVSDVMSQKAKGGWELVTTGSERIYDVLKVIIDSLISSEVGLLPLSELVELRKKLTTTTKPNESTFKTLVESLISTGFLEYRSAPVLEIDNTIDPLPDLPSTADTSSSYSRTRQVIGVGPRSLIELEAYFDSAGVPRCEICTQHVTTRTGARPVHQVCDSHLAEPEVARSSPMLFTPMNVNMNVNVNVNVGSVVSSNDGQNTIQRRTQDSQRHSIGRSAPPPPLHAPIIKKDPGMKSKRTQPPQRTAAKKPRHDDFSDFDQEEYSSTSEELEVSDDLDDDEEEEENRSKRRKQTKKTQKSRR